MRQDVEIRIVHRTNHPFALLVSTQIKPAVDGTCREVQLLQHTFTQVERLILQNVDLDALQHANPIE
jgi:hypothetical protein